MGCQTNPCECWPNLSPAAGTARRRNHPHDRFNLPRLSNASSHDEAVAFHLRSPISPSGTHFYPPCKLIRPMTNDAPRLSLLEELDARQNELLDELDRLNSRIEQVLQACLACQPAPQPVKVVA